MDCSTATITTHSFPDPITYMIQKSAGINEEVPGINDLFSSSIKECGYVVLTAYIDGVQLFKDSTPISYDGTEGLL